MPVFVNVRTMRHTGNHLPAQNALHSEENCSLGARDFESRRPTKFEFFTLRFPNLDSHYHQAAPYCRLSNRFGGIKIDLCGSPQG